MSEETTLEELLPVITDFNKHYYDSLEKGELVAKKCNDCDHSFLPAAKYCPNCLSENVDWKVLSGEGTVYSWVEYHRPYHEAFKDKVPYVVAIVELKEGPRLISNIIDYDLNTLKVGTQVEAVFTKGFSNFPMVNFREK
ncbi:Zn-ribbon domain-containing OB-fold protein [Psychrobacillus sp. OK032]|uniref:Zn-ribbon domain-containing OB-fold protein n=1 Tax=Psychrobacillus sp. OK032 TaxID=1884358 RepID=UPI0008BDB6D2|nr:Zn-ribbon domain-containing OB-fold protein [Psychrobacillus sp. OK032]SER81823.1 hypothetical protein SAMN05518872_102181 [Psychrobacillus sp. OK032]